MLCLVRVRVRARSRVRARARARARRGFGRGDPVCPTSCMSAARMSENISIGEEAAPRIAGLHANQ